MGTVPSTQVRCRRIIRSTIKHTQSRLGERLILLGRPKLRQTLARQGLYFLALSLGTYKAVLVH